jgi:hypothetical protein
MLVGDFEDDYGIRYHLSPDLWHQRPDSRYHVVQWDSVGQYLIARNDATNPADGNLWTRIDWLPLEGMPPWEWAFCLTVWNAPSEDEARETAPADRSSPRTGCGGFPFSRMRRMVETGSAPGP